MVKDKKEVEPVQAIGSRQAVSQHIKKRALKNKALAISFNDKDLKDYVGGFHKRKKKRRKEANQQLAEKLRLKRIEKRKQRKQERAYVEGSAPATASDELDQDDDEEETEIIPPVADTKFYDAGELKILVTTSEISREEEEKIHVAPPPGSTKATGKKKPVVKAKPISKPQQRRSGPKPQKKREKRKGKISKAQGR
ncbi:hypothetical protein ACHQM5_030200 [Ranunculus cassubicifolius]